MTVSATRSALAALALATFATATPARAEVTFCNEFTQLIYVAIAYPQAGGSWLSRGWMSLDPHDCAPFDTALRLKTVYYRAESAPYRGPGGKRVSYTWGQGGRNFAIWRDDNFNYWGAEAKVLNSRLEGFKEGPTTDDPEGLDVTITFQEGSVITSFKGSGASSRDGSSSQSNSPKK